MLEPYGAVVSCRILRDYHTQASRGVGFARMQTRETCEQILAVFNGSQLEGESYHMHGANPPCAVLANVLIETLQPRCFSCFSCLHPPT